MSVASIPQMGDGNVSEYKKIVKRCSSSGRPISMGKVETEVFILCYDSECDFVIYYTHPASFFSLPLFFLSFFLPFILFIYKNPSLTIARNTKKQKTTKTNNQPTNQQKQPNNQNKTNKTTEFGVYVDRYGVPILDREVVEWEGQADRASFRFPYILLFCSAFVEVRHLITGHLTQIIRPEVAAAGVGAAPGGGGGAGGGPGGGPGGPETTLRCLWDGRGGARNFDDDSHELLGSGGSAGHHYTTAGTGVSDGSGSSVELPTTLGAVDLAIPVTSDEWGAQSSSSSTVTQQCVFTLFAPIPPPYSLLEESVVPYDANSII